MGRTPGLTDRKATVLEALSKITQPRAGVAEAVRSVGINPYTYRNWRRNDPDFRLRSDGVLKAARDRAKIATSSDHIFDPRVVDNLPPPPPLRQFRWEAFGRPTWPHHEPLIEAWEDPTNRVVFCFMPPGAGKDTIAGDAVCQGVCRRDRKKRAWIMEAEGFSKRRGQRLAAYLTDPRSFDRAPDGPGCVKPTLIIPDKYGPFAWNRELRFPDGTKVPRRAWSAHEMYFVGVGDQETDPDLWWTGTGGQVYGSRIQELYLSDPYTRENQYSPTERVKQREFFHGTLLSRLDGSGRILMLNTRVGTHDNGGAVMDEMTAGARVIKQEGFYTKWSNGVATIIVPAIQVDDGGREQSYWPEKFPLDSGYLMPDGMWVPGGDLSDSEIQGVADQGGGFVEGLRQTRDRIGSELWNAMYQQAPEATEGGEFTPELLDYCDDPTRSYGVLYPGEIGILGVDPARAGGAGWLLWAWSPREGTLTVADYFWARNLGTHGIREQLLVDPISRYWPRYTGYESNRESSSLDHPDVRDAVDSAKTDLIRLHTGQNRNVGDLRVAAMSLDMRVGLIRFPTASGDDRARTAFLKQQFLNWDARTFTEGRTGAYSTGTRLPDDLVMAGWVGWQIWRDKIYDRTKRQSVPPRPVAGSTQARYYPRGYTKPARVTAVDTDLLAAWSQHD